MLSCSSSQIETGSGPATQNQATRAARLGELEAIVDKTQADDGPEILTRSATPIPMPNGETAPQTDGQKVTVANIDQITKGDGQKVSSHLTPSGQRSLKEEVRECVERIQADMRTFKDAQLRLADDLFWLLDPVFNRFKQVYKTRKACIAACTGKSRQWGYELVGLGKSRWLARKNGASEEQLPDSIPSSKKWLSTHNEDGTPKPQSQSPVNPSGKALNGDPNDTLEIAEIPFRPVIESGIPIPAEQTFIDLILSQICILFADDKLSAATHIQNRERIMSCLDEVCPPKSLRVKPNRKSNRKKKPSEHRCLSYGDQIISTKVEDTLLIS